MSREVLEQISALVGTLSPRERRKLVKGLTPRKAKLSPIEETRRRQGRYKKDLHTGRALFGAEVR